MTKKNCRRFLLAAIMLLLTGFLAATDSGPGVAKCAPGAANARCTSLPVYTYYTDASKTVACGYLEVCSGAEEGCHTEYKTSERKPCGCGSALSASSEK
ncbi:MAG: hypothetical protein QOH49_494 [Acidobacteriota bacterium]|jgi:hypothetical protein|nr:hypothetical protein [Acidobacteriota bacterium]